jgi:predicted RecA/RadA family phage recombinase
MAYQIGEADFVHGDPLMIDHTPGSAVAAGEVVVVDDLVYICHRAIAANALGALAAGGGVYDGIKDNTSGPDIAAGDRVYFIPGSNLFTNDGTGGNKFAGYAIAAAGASVTPVRFVHVLGDMT